MKEKFLILLILLSVGSVGSGFGQTENKPVKIKKKPVAENRGANCSKDSGQAMLSVTFDKSAKVSAAEVAKSSGCTEFDDSALKAAFSIEFEPLVKDGEAITVTKKLIYKYKIY